MRNAGLAAVLLMLVAGRGQAEAQAEPPAAQRAEVAVREGFKPRPPRPDGPAAVALR